MTDRAVFIRRRLVAAAVLTAAIGLPVAAFWPAGGSAQGGPPGSAVLPELGVGDDDAVIFGAVGSGAQAGETWAFRRLPLETPEPVADGKTVQFGPVDAGSAEPQLAFLRHTAQTGWQVAAVPHAESGAPLRGALPNPRSARMTDRGAAVLVGQDSSRPADEQAVLMVREAGKDFVTVPTPQSLLLPAEEAVAPTTPAPTTPAPTTPVATTPGTTPDPTTPATTPDPTTPTTPAAADPTTPTTPTTPPTTPDATTPTTPAPTTPPAPEPDQAERLAGDRGTGRVNIAVVDGAGDAGAVVLLAPVGRKVEGAVLRYARGAWTREAIVLPDDPASFRVGAITASADGAWLVGTSPGKPVRLFARDAGRAGGPAWVEVTLPASALTDDAAATAAGLTDLAPAGGQAQTLTASGARVWIDLRALRGESPVSATLLVNPAAPVGSRVTSWCDDTPSACDHPLGAAFSTTDGYRSFAWAGAGSGTRVITNPLRRGGDADSNRGTWLTLEGDRFVRRGGGGGNFRPSGAFRSPTSGWLEGPVEVGADGPPAKLRKWPSATRSPLTAIASEPGKAPGALDAAALAVGSDGGVARYTPAGGWTREFLLSSTGSVVRAALRGVAWPEPGRAHAVGDLGAIWQWRADTGLWERDPATPVGFEANLTAVAFDPSSAERGYAVGKEGALLSYGKTWEQQPLPEGFADADFSGISFAGRQAIAVSDQGVLVNSGSGWTPDADANALLDGLPGLPPRMVAVSGLPDGGAVIGGQTVVLIRDRAGAGWRFAEQPLLGLTVATAAAVRDGEAVRAVVATVPALQYPVPDVLIAEDPDVPTPLIPPYPVAGDGYLLRETATGWRDEQRAAFAGSGDDRPTKADPVLALSLGADGTGWAVGGWSGAADSAGRGTAGVGGAARVARSRVQTGAVLRYDPAGAPAGTTTETAAEIPLPGNAVRFAIGGHPQCAAACADLANQDIAPDRMLSSALDLAGSLAQRPGGPRAFLSTGGRIRAGSGAEGSAAEEDRFASLLGERSGLPIYNATADGDIADGSAATYSAAFAGSAAPFGNRPVLGSVTDGIPGKTAPAGAARTHYAFDSAGGGGTVRVVVLDNSAGSLAESDAHQVPAEPQEPWLTDVLDDAKKRSIPAIVIGSRDINPRARPALNVASDGDRIAQLLVDHGASAYFFDRPEENRTSAVPAGGAVTIPSFGTGTLGYRSGVEQAESIGLPDALFGDGGFLLAELDLAARDAATNRVPVSVRLIPVIESLSLNAIDGTLLRRSRPALFQGLGRKPVAGDRWGRAGGDGVPSPTGADPYTEFPADPCLVAGCSSRILPEFSFSSSDPDILDMVKVDPATSNQRKPLLGADDKVITDAASGLVCPFNAGTTTVTVTAGGRAISQPITVLPGSVLRPCGTRPLSPDKIKTRAGAAAGAAAPPPPASAPPAVLAGLVPPPPPPAPQQPVAEKAAKAAIIPAAAPLFDDLLAPTARSLTSNSVSPPPPAPGFFAQPIPPGGATVRVTEEKRETEIATEESSAYARIEADDRLPVTPFIAGLALIAALAGTTIRPGRRRGPAYARITTLPPPRRPQRYRRSHK